MNLFSNLHLEIKKSRKDDAVLAVTKRSGFRYHLFLSFFLFSFCVKKTQFFIIIIIIDGFNGNNINKRYWACACLWP